MCGILWLQRGRYLSSSLIHALWRYAYNIFLCQPLVPHLFVSFPFGLNSQGEVCCLTSFMECNSFHVVVVLRTMVTGQDIWAWKCARMSEFVTSFHTSPRLQCVTCNKSTSVITSSSSIHSTPKQCELVLQLCWVAEILQILATLY